MSIFTSFEERYPEKGMIVSSGKNIATEICAGSRCAPKKITVEIYTKEPAEIILDGDRCKTKKQDYGICYCSRSRSSNTRVSHFKEIIIPAGVEFYVNIYGSGTK